MCLDREETTLHCLIQCDFAEACRQGAGFGNALDDFDNFADWLQGAMNMYDNLRLAKLVMLLWSVWKARNTVVWHDTYLHVDEVIRTAQITLDQWLEAQLRNFTPSVVSLNARDGSELWTKPDINTIKINVDAALFNDKHYFGFGCVAWDHSGRFLGAKMASKTGRITTNLAEVIAVKEALSWVKTNQWTRVLVESDCMKVVQALHISVELSSLFGLVVLDCRQLLQDIVNVEVCFIRRSANRVAHCLARQILFSF